VQEKFSEHILSEADLAAAMRRAINGSIKDIEQIENELAVHLYQEIMGRSVLPNEIPIVEEHFSKAVEELVAAARHDAAKAAGNVIVAEAVSQIATKVFTRLGVSSGILTMGASQSWWTFGASFGIGILASIIWEWIDDPVGDIEVGVTSVLSHLSAEISAAFATEMNMIISQRSEIWRNSSSTIILELLP